MLLIIRSLIVPKALVMRCLVIVIGEEADYFVELDGPGAVFMCFHNYYLSIGRYLSSFYLRLAIIPIRLYFYSCC